MATNESDKEGAASLTDMEFPASDIRTQLPDSPSSPETSNNDVPEKQSPEEKPRNRASTVGRLSFTDSAEPGRVQIPSQHSTEHSRRLSIASLLSAELKDSHAETVEAMESLDGSLKQEQLEEVDLSSSDLIEPGPEPSSQLPNRRRRNRQASPLGSPSTVNEDLQDVDIVEWIGRDVFPLTNTRAQEVRLRHCLFCGVTSTDQLRRHIQNVHGDKWRKMRLGELGTSGFRQREPAQILSGHELVAAVHIIAAVFDPSRFKTGNRLQSKKAADFDGSYLAGEKAVVRRFIKLYPKLGSPGVGGLTLAGEWTLIKAPLERWLNFYGENRTCRNCGKILSRPDARIRHERTPGCVKSSTLTPEGTAGPST